MLQQSSIGRANLIINSYICGGFLHKNPDILKRLSYSHQKIRQNFYTKRAIQTSMCFVLSPLNRGDYGVRGVIGFSW